MKVKEIIKLIGQDGWYLKETRGSHRQYKHNIKKGRVTIAGKMSRSSSENLKKYFKTISNRTMKYAIIIEKGENNFSAYVPDLSGCVSTGETIEETKQNIHDAIEFHIDGLKEDGEEIPAPLLLVTL